MGTLTTPNTEFSMQITSRPVNLPIETHFTFSYDQIRQIEPGDT